MGEEDARKKLVVRKQKAWNVYRGDTSVAYKLLQERNDRIREQCKERRANVYQLFQEERTEAWLTLQIALIAAQRSYDEMTGRETVKNMKLPNKRFTPTTI